MTVTAIVLAAVLSGASPSPATPSGPSYDEWRAFVHCGHPGLFPMEFAGVERGEPVFRLNGLGPAKPAKAWLNARARSGLGPGVYFFDTVEGRSPQGGGGTLTPPIRIRCRGGAFFMPAFAYFNAERVTCRCWRRRAVEIGEEDGRPGLPRAHAAGVRYNEGDLTLSAGFTVFGAVRSGGVLSLRNRAAILENPDMQRPDPHRTFPPPQWKVDAPTPTTWPMAPPDSEP